MKVINHADDDGDGDGDDDDDDDDDNGGLDEHVDGDICFRCWDGRVHPCFFGQHFMALSSTEHRGFVFQCSTIVLTILLITLAVVALIGLLHYKLINYTIHLLFAILNFSSS